MKNYFLCIASILHFSLALPASAPGPLGLRQAIVENHDVWALHLIDEGTAEYTGPERLQVLTVRAPKGSLRFNFSPLALATYYDRLPVVQTLLSRGHSPFESIPVQVEIIGNPKGIESKTITILKMATTWNKLAAPLFEAHLTLLIQRTQDTLSTEPTVQETNELMDVNENEGLAEFDIEQLFHLITAAPQRQ